MSTLTFKQGNLLEAEVQALVNTVNTVGIMGKGIALMFKENFPDNFQKYEQACEAREVRTGKMFVVENKELFGPKWIINFPTKQHWRTDSKLVWIEEGLVDLRRVIEANNIHSIAIPPLGSGNGGLEWSLVKPLIVEHLQDISNLDIVVYEPTSKYQNVAKRSGVERLTIARALVCEVVRRYCLLGNDCSIIEIQKLAWFVERGINHMMLENPLNLGYSANKYGPYSEKLRHLLNGLDGSYLHCDKRLADATPLDCIWFDNAKNDRLQAFINSGEAKTYVSALDWTSNLIEGFESPLGMELLATVDWLIKEQRVECTPQGIKLGLKNWPGGATPADQKSAAERKTKIFNDRLIELAMNQLGSANSRLC